MFDVVASHQNQLTLAIKGIGVDEAEPRLPRASPAGHAQAISKNKAIEEVQDQQRDENAHQHQHDL